MTKKIDKKCQKVEKNAKNFVKKIQNFLAHFTQVSAPPPENILFLTPKKSIKVYLWS